MCVGFALPATTSWAAQAGSSDMKSMHSAGAQSQGQVELREAMRKLWSDHVFWTREYVIAAVDGTPDAQAAAARLLKNQEDIGAGSGSRARASNPVR
jgi:hypothetical protein